MDRKAYAASDITVVSFEEAVRMRPGMYFAAELDSPDLPTNILKCVINDVLHAPGGGHHPVDVEVTTDMGFTVTDEQPPDLDDLGEPKPGFYGSLIGRTRWALAAAAAFSSHALIEVQAGSHSWRQELTGTAPGRPVPFTPSVRADGTRATFTLNPSLLTAGAVISISPEQLWTRGSRCGTCTSPQREVTIRDRRRN